MDSKSETEQGEEEVESENKKRKEARKGSRKENVRKVEGNERERREVK